ncbi:urea ABC transporter ATP-binding subunit UrtE [Kallotenue papyrolyticum]|uniref:urea ABC transporter ATP-binding subunit UrtE n=1 Tax=Kallotenue papyrolyticum TaxID=1325125 RepID=UPI00047861AD|nr:urea ABC transporter ATP-binding subunit UrtE [Kallotenue papyrolyticum]
MLELNQIAVNYGESPILRDIHLQVPSGQVVCLMGRNGVGKTTLMKSIMGLLKLRSGDIHFEGKRVTHWRTSQRARAGFGYVPQGRGIFPYLTVYENLLMGFEAAENMGRDERKAALDEVYTLFPMLKEMRHRVAGTLSGGQQQQLAFARVLIRRPKLLLLDEPTEGIQPSIMLEIEELILALRERGEISILLVEQFLDFALNVGSYFYVMETGAIVLEGDARNLDRAAAREYLAV